MVKRKKTVPHPWQEAVAASIVRACVNKQLRWANWLQAQSKKLPRRGQQGLALLFFLSGVVGSLYILWNAIK